MIASSMRSEACTSPEARSHLRSSSSTFFRYTIPTKEKSMRFLFTWLPLSLLRYIVCFIYLSTFCAHSYLIYKLYAAIYKWSTGEQQIQEFSANAYLDVYNGHVNMLKHILEHREGAFNLMMADIYAQAKSVIIIFCLLQY